MRTTIRRASLMIAAALMVITPTPSTEANSFSIHAGNGHFSMSMGFGDWGAYGNNWYDHNGSLDYEYALNGYGEWIWVDGLERVWRPYVNNNWRPYTHGRWVYTDLGWTWVSYEPWGYIPHHYGEWAYTTYGWAWVPGYTYRPANVVWFRAGVNVGWYACAPRGWSHYHRGYNYSYNRGYNRGYRHGYDNGYWDGWQDASYGTSVPWQHMGADNVAPYAQGRQKNFVEGQVQQMHGAPSRRDAQRAGATVRHAELDRRTVTMGDHKVTMARPRGMAESVERHGGHTAKQALTADAHKNLDQRRAAAKNANRAPAGRDQRYNGDRRPPTGDHKRGTLDQNRRHTDNRRPSTEGNKRGTLDQNRRHTDNRRPSTEANKRGTLDQNRRHTDNRRPSTEADKRGTLNQNRRHTNDRRPPTDRQRRGTTFSTPYKKGPVELDRRGSIDRAPAGPTKDRYDARRPARQPKSTPRDVDRHTSRGDRRPPTSVAPQRSAERDQHRSREARGSKSDRPSPRHQSISRPPSDSRRRAPANSPESRGRERSKGNKGRPGGR